MKIAITGATGFLGRDLTAMATARGHEIVAIARGLSGPTDFAGGATFIRSDLNDTATLRHAFAGCDIVIHAAALSSPWGRRADFEHVNRGGTGSVVEAARQAGVRRLVHVSSTSLYFAFQDRFSIREDDPLPEPVNAYAATKRQAEEEAGRFEGEVFIARPRGIFGPGDPHLLPRLLKVARVGPLPLFRGGQALVDISFVSTVSNALLAMAAAPPERAGIYNIAQGEPIAIRELVERLIGGLGQQPRWRRLPVGLALAAARLLETAARIDPKKREPFVTAYSLGLFAFSQTLDLSKAHDWLGWRAPIGLAEALDRTITAFRDHP